MSNELLQQALDALEYHTAHTRPIHRIDAAIKRLREALAQPVQPASELERYLAANYPAARGDDLAARVIDALETMDIELGLKDIARPAQPSTAQRD